MVSRYAAIAQDNRRRFLDKLKENGLDQGYIYLQGGVTQYAKWSDSYYPFRQEKNF